MPGTPFLLFKESLPGGVIPERSPQGSPRGPKSPCPADNDTFAPTRLLSFQSWSWSFRHHPGTVFLCPSPGVSVSRAHPGPECPVVRQPRWCLSAFLVPHHRHAASLAPHWSLDPASCSPGPPLFPPLPPPSWGGSRLGLGGAEVLGAFSLSLACEDFPGPKFLIGLFRVLCSTGGLVRASSIRAPSGQLHSATPAPFCSLKAEGAWSSLPQFEAQNRWCKTHVWHV